MKLVILTQPTFFVEEDKIITALFDEGMDMLHLQKPNSEFDLKGIHIDNPDTPTPAEFKRNVTRSTYRISDLKEMKKKCDYVCLHSLFDSLHGNMKASLTIQEMEQARDKGLIDKHVYALGGMSIENIRMAKELGFGGVCICGDLWNRFSIQHELNFKELIDHFRKLRKAVG